MVHVRHTYLIFTLACVDTYTHAHVQTHGWHTRFTSSGEMRAGSEATVITQKFKCLTHTYMHMHTYIHTFRQTHGRTDRQTETDRDRPTDKQTGRQETDVHKYMRTCRHAYGRAKKRT